MPAELEHQPDLAHQLFLADGLGQKGIGAGRGGLSLLVVVADGGDNDDRDVLGAVVSLNPPATL